MIFRSNTDKDKMGQVKPHSALYYRPPAPKAIILFSFRRESVMGHAIGHKLLYTLLKLLE